MAGRVSSEVVEVLPSGGSPAARVSSLVAEVMVWAAPPPPRRVSSQVVEVLPAGQTNAYARVSSLVVEVMVSAGGGGSVMSGYWW
jgi:hypothetical protein